MRVNCDLCGEILSSKEMRVHDQIIYKNCHVKLNFDIFFYEKKDFESEKEAKKHQEEIKKVQEMWDELNEKEKDEMFAEEQLEKADQTEIFVADCLCNFIKHNTNLHHLDLQGCGLTTFVLCQIARALRKTRSLVGIHLSENPGIDNEGKIKRYFHKKVRCKLISDFSTVRTLDFTPFENVVKKQHPNVNHAMF